MSIIDKALGAVTPPESDEQRREATQRARSMAEGGDWLSDALDHHERIRAAFEAGRSASDAGGRMRAFKTLALVLNGHALAEEIVLYPALAKAGEKGHAGMAYSEQTTAKMQMAELERIEPMSDEWLDKWEHIRGAILHHIYEEEGTWFVELKQKYDEQAMLTARFREEFERYAGGEREAAGLAEPRSISPSQPQVPPSAH